MSSARQTAYELLLKTELEGAYSNIALDKALSAEKLTERDRAFAAALFYGVLERKMTLDYIIRSYSSIEYDRIEKSTVQLLRIGLYQLVYMNGVPDSAAVNETVKLCPQKTKGFVNAVLRSFLRDGKKTDYDGLDGDGRLSVMYSCPKRLIKMWRRDYGAETTERILAASFGRPPLYAKVNTLICNADDLIYELAVDNIRADRHEALDDCVVIDAVGAAGIEGCRAYKNGLFHVQDISSQLCCRIVAPEAGETVLDMCAAPGGKSFSMAEAMENRGRLLSLDLYDGRVSLISEGARRLGLDIIEAGVNDASVFNEKLPMADRVLCDAVCSGLGVIRRKPEIKYKQKHEIDALPAIQAQILDTASRYVKKGGVLVYSTCTLNKAENEEVVNAFLRGHGEFMPVPARIDENDPYNECCRTFLPDEKGGDGFFTAKMKRV